MAFRTLEISTPSDVHIKRGQLEITNDEGTIMIPLEDLATIVCSGANIRMSTMAQAQLAQAGVSLMVIDNHYQPSCMVIPMQSNIRQTLVMRNQIAMTSADKDQMWIEIITRKIENQARTLALLGKEGAEKVMRYASEITADGIDAYEANAAREYFQLLHPGLNRRNDDPVNSCLNYGYAVLRNAIIRSIVLAGFQPMIGIHHDNYLNAFNLADDLIEPWRPFVDIIAADDPGTSVLLSRNKRKEIAEVLHHACLIDGTKISVLSGIDEMIGSIRSRVVCGANNEIKLPVVVPVEIIEAIKE